MAYINKISNKVGVEPAFGKLHCLSQHRVMVAPDDVLDAPRYNQVLATQIYDEADEFPNHFGFTMQRCQQSLK